MPTEESLFAEALALPAPERVAFLDRACPADPALRARVQALLDASADADFLAAPAPRDDGPTEDHAPDDDPTVDAPRPAISEGPGTLIGPYKLLQKIGEGGMGAVFMAEQERPVRRKVALKVIKPGMDTSQVIARFEAERQALAMMDHTNIARVLDAGATDTGRPFFVMELVKGVPITEYCDRNQLTPKQRLELFIPVCQAIQHAHQKGIIHRDIKPSNVLVTLHDGVPVPKVIDFGVAKATDQRLTERTIFTEFGAVIGTLEYMSPEQAEMGALDIDTRSDIYSLGVLLYELLTGSTPLERAKLRKAAYSEILRRIREEEPTKPSTRLSESKDALPSISAQRKMEPARLTRLVRGDLDWIVMKSLEKDRTRRYETATGFAKDIRRYLDGDAVEACPPSMSYRMGKFLKRNKGPVLAASLLVLALVAGFIGTAWGLVRADRARQAESAQRKIAVAEKRKAEDQRSRAETREVQAIDAVKKFRDAVADNPELKNNPALESLRKTLLKEPLAFFRALRDRLQADRDTRPESLARLAQASFDLGLLTAEIGNKQDALIAHRESLAIRRTLADANPTANKYQSDLASSHHNIGLLLDDTGEPAEALEAYKSAMAILQPLADANPAVTDFQRDLALSHHNIGGVLGRIGKPIEGLAAYGSALAIQRRLAVDNPTVTKFQRDLAMSHNNIGVALTRTGKPTEALEAYRSALAIRRTLAVANPTVTAFQHNLAGSHVNIGLLLSGTGKPAEALEAYKSALAILQTLADANPTVIAFQRDLSKCHNNIGMLLNSIGKPTEALKAYEAALPIREKLARDHAESPDNAGDLGRLLSNIAEIEFNARRFDEARDRLQQAVYWQKKALTSNPANQRYRLDLATHLAGLALVARGRNDPGGMAEVERELARLHDSDPTMVAVDARLSAIIKGGQLPKDSADRLQLPRRAYAKGLHATAARLWIDAIGADPKFADDRQNDDRYHAACAAALAGSGQGKDDPAPDDAAKAKLRKQAHDWLKAELAVWERVARTIGPGNQGLVERTLGQWKAEANLAGIRDEGPLAKLPKDERGAFEQLWKDVDELLAKTAIPK